MECLSEHNLLANLAANKREQKIIAINKINSLKHQENCHRVSVYDCAVLSFWKYNMYQINKYKTWEDISHFGSYLKVFYSKFIYL